MDVNIDLDFDLLVSGLPNDKIITPTTKKLILNLAYIYNINTMEMQSLIKNNITDKGYIHQENLRKACRNYYQFENSGRLPGLIHKSQPEYLRKPIDDNSKRAKKR